MLKKVGNKWISETAEGSFELTQEEAYFEIPIQMLELLKKAESGDEQTDIDNAAKAKELYNASSNIAINWVFFADMTRKSVMPLLDAISKDNQPPRTCEYIALYAVREMWGRICNQQDTDILWELFSFYRDKVFPLTLRKSLVEGEQYVRIAYAFYWASGLKGNQYGLPIISMLNNLHKNNLQYEMVIEQYNEDNKNKTFNMGTTVSDARNGIYFDLVQIPKLIADKALALSKTLYISESQKHAYLLSQNGYDIVQKVANTKYDMVDEVANNNSLTHFYKESMEYEWYGFCFVLASLLGKESDRKNIAAKVGEYSLDRIERRGTVISSALANIISLVVLIASIIGIGFLEKTGHIFIAAIVAMGLIVLQNGIAHISTNVFKNYSLYNFVWMLSIMVPMWFLIRRGHLVITLVAAVVFFVSYKFAPTKGKNTTAYIIACSMRVLLPCTIIYFNHIYTAILVMILPLVIIYRIEEG